MVPGSAHTAGDAADAGAGGSATSRAAATGPSAARCCGERRPHATAKNPTLAISFLMGLKCTRLRCFQLAVAFGMHAGSSPADL